MRKLHTDVQMRITIITVKSKTIYNLRLKLQLPKYTKNKTTNRTTLNQNNVSSSRCVMNKITYSDIHSF